MHSFNFTHTLTNASAPIHGQFLNTTENDMFNFEDKNTSFQYKKTANYSKAEIITHYIVIMCVGVIGNVMVPIVILKSKDMLNSMNIFLVNMSVADLTFLLICMPISILSINFKIETWVLGKELCLAEPFLEQLSWNVSVFTILAVSFERYYVICKPFRAGLVCTKTRAVLICVFIWFFAALFGSYLLFSTKKEYFNVNYKDGSYIFVRVSAIDNILFKIFHCINNGVFFFVALIVLLVLYIVITKNLMKTSIIIPQNTNNMNSSSNKIRYRKQVIIMLGTVIIAFFVCFLPFIALQVSANVLGWDELKKALDKNDYNFEECVWFCYEMCFFHSAINPLLYNLMSSKFRKGFFKLLRINRLIKCSKISKENMQSQDTFTITTSTTL